MHRRDERDTARATRWWARLAGAVAGLAGLGIAGLIAWIVAPVGSPVPAVGELIIKLLPAPLVNFGKEVLGFADKPVLLTIIVAAVLIICGSGRRARVATPLCRRRTVRGGGRARPNRNQRAAGCRRSTPTCQRSSACCWAT